MSGTVKEMLGNSLARSTWDRYGSALRAWKSFAVDRKIPWRYFYYRLINDFITWCWKVRKPESLNGENLFGDFEDPP
jgi:hypothetical protein